MLKEMIYNSTYINELFTSNDFEFINEFDNEIAKLDIQIHNEEQKRDTVVNFINSLNEKIKSVPTTQIFIVQGLLNEVNDIFDLVNNNIKSLCSIEKDIETLNTEIINLLIAAQKDSGADSLSTEKVSSIKFSLTECANKLSEIQKTIFVNDIKIDKFIKDSLSNIDIELTVTQSHKKYDISKSILNILDDDPISSESSDNILKKEEDSAVSNTISTVDTPDSASISTANLNNTDIKDNDTLIISELSQKVYLPYTVSEVTKIYNSYSDDFSSYQDVINQEFILPLKIFSKHPSLARFRESYNLVRDREMKPLLDSLKYSFDLMFNYNLNPAVIAACKSQKELDSYLEALKKNDLDSFKIFKIKYEITPLKRD